MQARPEKAREFGLAALDRALDGVEGTTAVHICFGYAAIIHERPEAYSFLPELAAAPCDQISIETAQSNLDTSILATLPGKRIILGVIDLDDPTVETPETVADRIRRRCRTSAPDELSAAPDCGMKYLPRDVAYGKLEAMVAGAARSAPRAPRPPRPGGRSMTTTPSFPTGARLDQREPDRLAALAEEPLATPEQRREDHQPVFVDEVLARPAPGRSVRLPADQDAAGLLGLILRRLLRQVAGRATTGIFPGRVGQRRGDDVLAHPVHLVGEAGRASVRSGQACREALVS